MEIKITSLLAFKHKILPVQELFGKIVSVFKTQVHLHLQDEIYLNISQLKRRRRHDDSLTAVGNVVTSRKVTGGMFWAHGAFRRVLLISVRAIWTNHARLSINASVTLHANCEFN